MITRKALIAALDTMNKADVLVSQSAYRNCHPMAKTPLQKKLAELVGAQSVDARRYTNKRGVEHSSPTWLIEAYKRLAVLVYNGADINVRMILSTLK